jgi:hypothetical protein
VLAAKLEGYPSVGIELSKHYAHAAQERVDAGEPDAADADVGTTGTARKHGLSAFVAIRDALSGSPFSVLSVMATE